MEKIISYQIQEDSDLLEYIEEIELYKGYHPENNIPFFINNRGDNFCAYNEEDLNSYEIYLTKEEAIKYCNLRYIQEADIFELCKQIITKCVNYQMPNPLIAIGMHDAQLKNLNVIQELNDPVLKYFLSSKLYTRKSLTNFESRILKYINRDD